MEIYHQVLFLFILILQEIRVISRAVQKVQIACVRSINLNRCFQLVILNVFLNPDEILVENVLKFNTAFLILVIHNIEPGIINIQSTLKPRS